MRKINLNENIRKALEEDYPELENHYKSGNAALVYLAMKVNELIDELEKHKSVCH